MNKVPLIAWADDQFTNTMRITVPSVVKRCKNSLNMQNTKAD